MPTHTYAHTLFIDVCHGFDALHCTVTHYDGEGNNKASIEWEQNQARYKVTQDIKEVKQKYFICLNTHVVGDTFDATSYLLKNNSVLFYFYFQYRVPKQCMGLLCCTESCVNVHQILTRKKE